MNPAGASSFQTRVMAGERGGEPAFTGLSFRPAPSAAVKLTRIMGAILTLAREPLGTLIEGVAMFWKRKPKVEPNAFDLHLQWSNTSSRLEEELDRANLGLSSAEIELQQIGLEAEFKAFVGSILRFKMKRLVFIMRPGQDPADVIRLAHEASDNGAVLVADALVRGVNVRDQVEQVLLSMVAIMKFDGL